MGIGRGLRLNGVLVCLAAALLVAPPAAALADSPPSDQLFPLGGPSIVKARSIAVAYWGVTPCDGDIAVKWAALPTGVNALSTWWNQVAAYGNATGNRQCLVTLNPAESFDWPMLCTVLVHEYGHLSGHQHSTDPADVMYPTYSDPIAQCSESADPNPQAPAPASSTFAGTDPAAGALPAGAPRHKAPRHHSDANRSSRKRATKSSRRARNLRHRHHHA